MLVDQNGFALVLPSGLAAGEGCDGECCGCGWYRVRECSQQAQACGGGGGGPDSRIGYVWSCVTCAGSGRPLAVGDTFLWLGVCWTVLDVPIVNVPPQGALVRTETTPVICTNGCADPACPNPAAGVYYVATPCVADGTYPTVYVCFDGTCTVFNIQVFRTVNGQPVLASMCYVARRANSVPADQLPPGAQTFDLRGLTGFRTCCECIAAGRVGDTSCAIGQLWNGTTGGCWPDEDRALTPCCCGLDAGGDFSGRLRVDRFDATQEVGYNGGGGVRFLITRRIDSQTFNSEGCPTVRIREHLIDNATGTEGESFYDVIPGGGRLPSCRNCGWGFVPVNYPPQGALVGGPGQTWGIDCEGFNVDAAGQPIDPQFPWCTADWSLTIECDRVILNVTYVYFDPVSVQTITTSFATEMHYQYGTEDERCNGGCTTAGNAIATDGTDGARIDGVEGYMDAVIATRNGAAGVKKAVRDTGAKGFRSLIQV